MYNKTLIGLSVFLVVVAMVSGNCTNDLILKITKCQTDYTTSIAKVDQNDKSTYCGPLFTWQACLKPYIDQCSDNSMVSSLEKVMEQLKPYCSGTVSVQFSFFSLAVLLVLNILFK